MEISKYYVGLINKYRQNRTYADTDATTFLLGSTQNPSLEESQFFRILNYRNGGSKYGYWNYNHMYLQLENFVDVVVFISPHLVDEK